MRFNVPGEARWYYTLSLKKVCHWMFDIITLANVDRFSKFFHQFIRKKILHVKTTDISISPAICFYTTLWNSKIQKNVTECYVERDNS